MIPQESVNLAYANAAAFAANGKVVAARPGTVIAELTRYATPFNSADVSSGANWAASVQETSAGTLDNPSQHDLEMDGYVADISKAVVSHIAFAKNVVKPLVEEFSQKYEQACEAIKPADASSAFEIVTLRLPELLKDESFLDTLTPFKDKSILTPDLPLSLSPKTSEELQELIMIGNERMDRLVLEWLSQKPENFLTSVWNSFFTREQVSAGTNRVWNLISQEDLRLVNAFDKADISLAIFLFTRKITSQIQEDSGLSLSAYKNICLQYSDYAGATIVDALKKIDLFIRNKVLVIEQNEVQKYTKLNGEIYGAWLESGGSPEVILGMLSTGLNLTSTSLIDNKKDDLIRQWNSYVTFFRTNESNQLFMRQRAVVENLFMQMLTTPTEEEKEYFAKNTAYFDNMVKTMREAILLLSAKDLMDQSSLGLLFIAKIRFSYTCAFQILSDIVEAHRVNPNVDVREAALLSVINYMADYVSDQLTLIQA